MTGNKVFNDDSLNLRFLNQGYIKLKLFDARELKHLKTIFKKYNYYDENERKKNLILLPKTTLNRKNDFSLQTEIRNLFNDKLADLFCDFEYFSTTFLMKKRRHGKMDWHNDPSAYREDIFHRPIAIWGTINKAKYGNGNLLLVPKSHKLSLPVNFVPEIYR